MAKERSRLREKDVAEAVSAIMEPNGQVLSADLSG
jgi:hypothetical protein